MRKQKIRGHNRRQKQIEQWRSDNLSLDLIHHLQNNCQGYYYVKLQTYPWDGSTRQTSWIKEPARKTKQKMLNGLLDIYSDWKNQLEQLGKPYYLKVWLFEPRFSQSQVVCAIGDSIEHYETIFFKPDTAKSINPEFYGELKEKLSGFNWDYRHDEDRYDNTDLGEPEEYRSQQDYEDSVRWFNKLLKEPHRKQFLEEPIGKITEVYAFKRGDLWLGEKH